MKRVFAILCIFAFICGGANAQKRQKAALESLTYESPQELLGEKFHVSPKILTLLNPGKVLDRAG